MSDELAEPMSLFDFASLLNEYASGCVLFHELCRGPSAAGEVADARVRLQEKWGRILAAYREAASDPVFMAEMDSLAGAPVPAVDPSRSTPETALTPAVRPVEGEDAALRKAAELVVVRMPRRPEADENGETPGVHLGPGAPIWDAIDALRAALAARAPQSARPTPETDQ